VPWEGSSGVAVWAALGPAGRGSPLDADCGGGVAARGVADVPDRVEAIRSDGAAWAALWDGHLDLDALAFDVTEHLTDMADAKARTERATGQPSVRGQQDPEPVNDQSLLIRGRAGRPLR
jgi:hypothetical protein